MMKNLKAVAQIDGQKLDLYRPPMFDKRLVNERREVGRRAPIFRDAPHTLDVRPTRQPEKRPQTQLDGSQQGLSGYGR